MIPSTNNQLVPAKHKNRQSAQKREKERKKEKEKETAKISYHSESARKKPGIQKERLLRQLKIKMADRMKACVVFEFLAVSRRN